MAPESAFAPQWTKLIARAWVDPSFKESFEADPAAVMSQYGIDAIGGKSVDSLAGKIQVLDQPTAGQDKPFMDGDTLMLPFPQPPRDYDTVVDPDSVTVAGAGSPGNAHPDWVTENGGVATVWTSGTPGVTGRETGQGPNDSKTPGGASKTQSNNQSIPSMPSVSPSSSVYVDGDDAGAEAGGEEAGEVAGEAAVEGGADAAADAAAAAAFLCA